MVFFTCNHCGESAKKPAVEKHYNQKCRGKHVSVSCMDCLKDFYGNEYVAHTKCISEAEKYSGKGYTEKESKNKGAKKQESWMEIIRSILHTPNYNLSPRARTAFQKLQSVDNVPRKKAKFQNFIASSLHMSQAHSEEIWKVLEKELEKMKVSKQVVANAGLEVNDEVKSEENVEKSKDEKQKKAAKRNPGEIDGVDSPVSKKNKTDETSVETQVIETNNENSSLTEKKSKDKKSKKEAKDTATTPTTNEKKSKDKKSKKQAKDEVEAAQSNSNVKSEQELDSNDKAKLERNGDLKSEENGEKSRDDDKQVSKANEENSSQTEKKSKGKKSKKGTKDTVEVPEINSETKSTTNEKKSKDKKSKEGKAKDELEAVESNSNSKAKSTTNVKLEQELDADTNAKLKIHDEAEKPAENGKKSKKKDSKNAATGNPVECESKKDKVDETSDQTQMTESNNEKKSFRDGEKQIKNNVGNVETNSEEKSKTNAKKSKDKKSKKHLKDNMDMGEAKPSNDEEKSRNEESKKDGNLNSGEDGVCIGTEKSMTQKSITTDETSLAEDGEKCLDKESKKALKRNLADSTDADMSEPKKTKSSENATTGKENCAQKHFCWTAEMTEIVNKHAEGISLEKLEKKMLKKYTDSGDIDNKQLKMFKKKFTKYLKKCTELHEFQLTDNIVKVC